MDIWRSLSLVNHIRVIWVYCFSFQFHTPVHINNIFCENTRYLTSKNYILPTISSDTPNSLESVPFECSWYPVGDKHDIVSSTQQTWQTDPLATPLETCTSIWSWLLKIEPEVLSNINWPWHMLLMFMKLYPNASTFAQLAEKKDEVEAILFAKLLFTSGSYQYIFWSE